MYIYGDTFACVHEYIYIDICDLKIHQIYPPDITRIHPSIAIESPCCILAIAQEHKRNLKGFGFAKGDVSADETDPTEPEDVQSMLHKVRFSGIGRP